PEPRLVGTDQVRRVPALLRRTVRRPPRGRGSLAQSPFSSPAGESATLRRVSRPALRLGAASLLLFAGAASSLLAAPPSAVRVTPTTPTTPASTAGVVLALSGHGWGHGLGMSQWGAYGYAKHGWTYDRILAHYYQGTTLGPAPVSRVRVQLALKKQVTLNSVTAWSVT